MHPEHLHFLRCQEFFQENIKKVGRRLEKGVFLHGLSIRKQLPLICFAPVDKVKMQG